MHKRHNFGHKQDSSTRCKPAANVGLGMEGRRMIVLFFSFFELSSNSCNSHFFRDESTKGCYSE
ncbi:hypothetical protein RchiOBHm_Chr1g0363441 [Rosa chinensis]|uniref:Uncharacterized protein n=1 Tax=Rosa chinensis TaxID=74649 RepID=A0A2P6SJH4_ROSCH|nr:hypothetical protein RchiOBHm_Chr1g0363441 [Rosa chinensis]